MSGYQKDGLRGFRSVIADSMADTVHNIPTPKIKKKDAN